MHEIPKHFLLVFLEKPQAFSLRKDTRKILILIRSISNAVFFLDVAPRTSFALSNKYWSGFDSTPRMATFTLSTKEKYIALAGLCGRDDVWLEIGYPTLNFRLRYSAEKIQANTYEIFHISQPKKRATTYTSALVSRPLVIYSLSTAPLHGNSRKY